MENDGESSSFQNNGEAYNGNNTCNGPAVHSSTSSKGKRKQWVLHDGPHGSLHRLRLRMAEEGCSHSQVALARQLLTEDSLESDQIAVHWLLKAADQGHYEAIDLLKNCLDSNRGITEHSYVRVKSFLEMSQNERAARSAAKSLFSSMSEGGDFITVQQLEQWLEENSSKKTSDYQITSYSGGELISEQHVLSAASVYSAGNFPPLLCLVSLFSRNLWATFCRWLSQTLSRFPFGYLRIPALVLVAILLLYPASRHSFPYVFTTWSMFLCLCVAVTVHVCRLREEWSVFRSWSALLSQQSNQLQPAVTERLYIQRTHPGTLRSFVAVALPCISLQPVWNAIHPAAFSMPYGEAAIIALLLFTFCWPPLKHTWDLTIEDAVCVLGWILLRLDYWDLSQLSFSYHVRPFLEFRFDIISVLAVCMLIPFYVRRAFTFRSFWHLFAWLLPHMASLTWLFLALQWTAAATLLGLLRGIGLVAAFIISFSHLTLLSKAYLALLCLTSYTLSPVVGLEPWTSVTLTLIVMLVLLASISLLGQRYSHRHVWQGPWITRISSLIKAAFVAVCVALLAVRLANPCKDLLQPEFSSNFSANLADENLPPAMDLPETITWEQYRNYCHQPAWKASSMAATQLACSALDSMPVQWEGVVKQVRITRRSNFVETLIRLLPDGWAQWLTCSLGNKRPDCKSTADTGDSFSSQQCRFLRKIGEQRGESCHLDHYASYEYEIEAEPHSVRFWETKPLVHLIGGRQFDVVARRLVSGDVVKFVGTFSVPSVGGPLPELRLSYLECVVCDQGPVLVNTIEKASSDKDADLVLNALQGTADFVLPPFIRVNFSRIL